MNKNNAKIPSEEEALDLLENYGLDEDIIEHSKLVQKKALGIAQKIARNGYDVNIHLISLGALLHDIGRYKENSLRHGVIGGEVLRKLGYSPKLARIAERHVLCGISKKFTQKFGLPNRNYLPETIEELIICYADKLIAGRQSVDLKTRYSAWIKKYDKNPLLTESMRRIQRFEKKIFKLMGAHSVESSDD